jgi:hypothetical protein
MSNEIPPKNRQHQIVDWSQLYGVPTEKSQDVHSVEETLDVVDWQQLTEEQIEQDTIELSDKRSVTIDWKKLYRDTQ